MSELNQNGFSRKIFNIIKGNKNNRCNICQRYFKEKGNLITHKKIHTGDRPYKCTYENCFKSFITLGNLKAHEDHHLGNKPFKCLYEGCDQSYSRQSRLQIHSRTHSGNKPFKCPFGDCDKGFNEKGNLKTHYRIHTGERPFICKFGGCYKAFKAHGHLKDHIKMHTRNKPYRCNICQKSYGRSGVLRNHMKIHIKIKSKLKCKFSNINFFEKKDFYNHKRTYHKSNRDNNINVESTQSQPKEHDEIVTVTSNVNDERSPINIDLLKKEFSPISSVACLINNSNLLILNRDSNSNSQVNTPRNIVKNMENTAYPVNNNNNLLKIPKEDLPVDNNISKEIKELTDLVTNSNNLKSIRTLSNLSNVDCLNNDNINLQNNLNNISVNNMNNIFGGFDNTPSNKTPMSKLETFLMSWLSKGQETVNMEEANQLYNFYSTYLNNYISKFNNDIKYASFNTLLQEMLIKGANGDQNYSLENILQIMRNINTMYGATLNTPNNQMTNQINNQNLIFNNSNSGCQNNLQNSSQITPSNYQSALNLLNYSISPTNILSELNKQKVNPNFGFLFDQSPQISYLQQQNMTPFSPLFSQQNMLNMNNNNTSGNTTNKNRFSVPRNQTIPTFSDYLNLYQYKN